MRVLITTVLSRSGLLTHVRDLASLLRESGIEVFIAIPKRPYAERKSLLGSLSSHPIHFYKSKKGLLRFATDERIDLIHSHSSRAFDASTSVAESLDVPLVLTLHGVRAWLLEHGRSMAVARRIIAVGPAQSWGVRAAYPEKVRLIPNGIDLERFQPAPRAWSIPTHRRLRVLWYGRAGRRMSTGLEVLDAVTGQFGDQIDVRMIGVAHDANVQHIMVRGWLENPIYELQAADVVFGHGRCLREAMACGNVGIMLMHRYGGIIDRAWFRTPDYTMGALPEYFFMPKPNAEQIAADLDRLNRDRKLLRRLKIEARKIAERYFDVREMVQKTITVYREALSGPDA